LKYGFEQITENVYNPMTKRRASKTKDVLMVAIKLVKLELVMDDEEGDCWGEESEHERE
jgi:hypothetical protein